MTAALTKLQEHCKELTDLTAVTTTISEEPPARIFVVLHKVLLPAGAYQLAESDVLYIADYQYPTSALDMFWTELAVVPQNGSATAGAEQIEEYLGRSWRRFSWHRNGIWDPTHNGVLDHFEMMQDRFARDAKAAA